jgi:hypothetical protein
LRKGSGGKEEDRREEPGFRIQESGIRKRETGSKIETGYFLS